MRALRPLPQRAFSVHHFSETLAGLGFQLRLRAMLDRREANLPADVGSIPQPGVSHIQNLTNHSRYTAAHRQAPRRAGERYDGACLLYTSDAADE